MQDGVAGPFSQTPAASLIPFFRLQFHALSGVNEVPEHVVVARPRVSIDQHTRELQRGRLRLTTAGI
jgi:hypothetical protein